MISLIVATLDRVSELERLLASLDSQTFRNFEVLIVDQNPDERLEPLLDQYAHLRIHHLRSPRGLSMARNVALPLVNGDVVAFPDDDCWYPSDLLSAVSQWFAAHPEYGGLFTMLRAEDGKPIVPRWPPGVGDCTLANVWSCTVSTTAFLRHSAVAATGVFEERIGLGAPTYYQSAEDIDYFIRALKLGVRMYFQPNLTVHHPALQDIKRLRRTAHSSALGVGYVMRKHGYSVLYFGRLVMRSFGGAAYCACKGDVQIARFYLIRASGQLRGYICGPHDLARYNSRMG